LATPIPVELIFYWALFALIVVFFLTIDVCLSLIFWGGFKVDKFLKYALAIQNYPVAKNFIRPLQ
jgi:hypothetical protein